MGPGQQGDELGLLDLDNEACKFFSTLEARLGDRDVTKFLKSGSDVVCACSNAGAGEAFGG
eukprot:8784874-Alexandrium_andersonii.AAC.1